MVKLIIRKSVINFWKLGKHVEYFWKLGKHVEYFWKLGNSKGSHLLGTPSDA